MKQLQDLVRPNIWALAPYSSARNEYAGHAAHVFLDANENPYNKPYNRYPDPLQEELKKKISKVKDVAPEKIFLGNGSDEAIDLCYRVFCEPKKANVVATEPTHGMYKVCADISGQARKRYGNVDEILSLEIVDLVKYTLEEWRQWILVAKSFNQS